MSDRERWVVYPLLFLTLGLTLRDKMTGTIERLVYLGGKSASMNFEQGILRAHIIDADLVRCRAVEVHADDGKPLVRLQSVEVPTGDGTRKKSGAITIHGQDGREIIVLRANHAFKGEFVREQKEGEPIKLVFKVKDVKEDGGLIEVFNGEKTLSLVLAHHMLESGLFAKNSKQQLARLSRVIERPSPPAESADPKAASASAPTDEAGEPGEEESRE